RGSRVGGRAARSFGGRLPAPRPRSRGPSSQLRERRVDARQTLLHAAGVVAVADTDVAADPEMRPGGDEDRLLAPQPVEQGHRAYRKVVAQKGDGAGQRKDAVENVAASADEALEPRQVRPENTARAL